MYTDKKFPPESSSLGNVGGDSANQESGKTNKDTVWLRAGSFAPPKDMKLFGTSVTPSDICQGALGDCWLLAAMACLAEHEGAMQALFQTREYNMKGKYTLRLYDGVKEEWEIIVVDDFIPCDADAHAKSDKSSPLFCQMRDNELWVVILEKAFAKFCGTYAALEGGLTIWALRAMTGDPARQFERDPAAKCWKRSDLVNQDDKNDRRACGLRTRNEKISDDMMFEILRKYDRLKSVLSASGAKESHGLHKGHAYSILKVIVSNQIRLVKIRNPWGSGEWTGDWSDKSELWNQHPAVRKAAELEDVNDGAFWMSWEDFVEHWARVGVVDRTIDINSLKLQVRNHNYTEPIRACCRGCGFFWCCCQGAKHLYFPHKTSDQTVTVKKGWCCFRRSYREARPTVNVVESE